MPSLHHNPPKTMDWDRFGERLTDASEGRISLEDACRELGIRTRQRLHYALDEWFLKQRYPRFPDTGRAVGMRTFNYIDFMFAKHGTDLASILKEIVGHLGDSNLRNVGNVTIAETLAWFLELGDPRKERKNKWTNKQMKNNRK